MWEVGIGPLEIVVLLVFSIGLIYSKPSGRWGGLAVACLIVAIFVSPPDPLSMLVVALPLMTIIAIGISVSGLITAPKNS